MKHIPNHAKRFIKNLKTWIILLYIIITFHMVSYLLVKIKNLLVSHV